MGLRKKLFIASQAQVNRNIQQVHHEFLTFFLLSSHKFVAAFSQLVLNKIGQPHKNRYLCQGKRV